MSANVDNPTWTAQGLRFTLGDYVSLPTLPEVAAFDIVFKPASEVTSASPPWPLPRRSLLILASSWEPRESCPLGRSILIKSDGEATGAADTVSPEWHLLQVDFRANAPHRWLFRLDGISLTTTIFGKPGKVSSDATILGRSGTGESWAFNGDLAYLLAYGHERSDAQIAQNTAALSALLAPRGVIFLRPS